MTKLTIDIPDALWVRTIAASASTNIISIADITRAEVTSALARRAREGSLRWTKEMS
jgi:hypothetical protein